MSESSPHILSVSFTALQLDPLIAAAHARGVRVTLAGSAERFAQFAQTAARADERVIVDLRGGDAEHCLDALAAAHQRTPFTGLFVPADPEALLAARLAERIGVPWNRVDAVRTITSKWQTRRTLAAHGFRQPEHHLVDTADAAARVVSTGGAWIIKPERGTASEGVSKVEDAASVGPALANLRCFQPTGPFVVERCVAPMTEYSVEGVWFNGRPLVAGITAKRTTGPPHFVETGHTAPVTLPPDLQAEIHEVVTGGLLALGASHGQFHVEVYVQPELPPGERVTFGEGHVRAGGDRITQIWALAGVDLDTLAVDAILGVPTDRLPRPSRGAASGFFAFPAGRVTAIEGLEEAQSLPGVVHLSIDVAPGDIIAPVVGSGNRLGRYVVQAGSFDAARALANQVERTLRVTIEPAVAGPDG